MRGSTRNSRSCSENAGAGGGGALRLDRGTFKPCRNDTVEAHTCLQIRHTFRGQPSPSGYSQNPTAYLAKYILHRERFRRIFSRLYGWGYGIIDEVLCELRWHDATRERNASTPRHQSVPSRGSHHICRKRGIRVMPGLILPGPLVRAGHAATAVVVLWLFNAAHSLGITSVKSRSRAATRSESTTTDDPTCRVAVCFSGHVRSFVYPVVHHSIRRNLVDAIEAEGCEVDIFAYATLTDAVPSFKQDINYNFTSSIEAVEVATNFLKERQQRRGKSDDGTPNTRNNHFELRWHQEQAGMVPNGCPRETARGQASYDDNNVNSSGNDDDDDDYNRMGHLWWKEFGAEATEGLYWQLYKSLAAFRMAQRREKELGLRYDWVVRTRFDLAWLQPLPPLLAFPRDAVWLGSHLWPIADPFALVPRDSADGFFSAISAYYACDGESWPPRENWWTPSCGRGGFEESVLLRYMCANGIYHRVYPLFPYIIVRGGTGVSMNTGGERGVAGEFHAICDLAQKALEGGFRPGYSLQSLVNWRELRTWTLLAGDNSTRKGGKLTRTDDLWALERGDAIADPDSQAWERLLLRVSRQTTDVEDRKDKHLPRTTVTTTPSAAGADIGDRALVEPRTTPASKSSAELELEGIHRRLQELYDAIVVPPSRYPSIAYTKVAVNPDTTFEGMLVAPEDQRGSVGMYEGGKLSGGGGEGGEHGGADAVEELDKEEALPFHGHVASQADCSFGAHTGRAPHRISTYNLDRALQRELLLAIKCLASSAIGRRRAWDRADDDDSLIADEFSSFRSPSRRGGDGSAAARTTPTFDGELTTGVGGEGQVSNECAGTRSLEMVMLEVSIRKIDLGICTVDNDTGNTVMENVLLLHARPERHCVWYGRLHIAQGYDPYRDT